MVVAMAIKEQLKSPLSLTRISRRWCLYSQKQKTKTAIIKLQNRHIKQGHNETCQCESTILLENMITLGCILIQYQYNTRDDKMQLVYALWLTKCKVIRNDWYNIFKKQSVWRHIDSFENMKILNSSSEIIQYRKIFCRRLQLESSISNFVLKISQEVAQGSKNQCFKIGAILNKGWGNRCRGNSMCDKINQINLKGLFH